MHRIKRFSVLTKLEKFEHERNSQWSFFMTRAGKSHYYRDVIVFENFVTLRLRRKEKSAQECKE